MVGSLEWLVFSGNNFSGTLPSELRQLSRLLVMYLAENELQGEFPLNLVCSAPCPYCSAYGTTSFLVQFLVS